MEVCVAAQDKLAPAVMMEDEEAKEALQQLYKKCVLVVLVMLVFHAAQICCCQATGHMKCVALLPLASACCDCS